MDLKRQRSAQTRKRKQEAVERSERPTLFEFSTSGIDAHGLRAGTNKTPIQRAEHDLRGNLIAPDAVRPSFVVRAPRLGHIARISDHAAPLPSEESTEQHLRAPLHAGGRPRRMGAATRAKYEYWDTMTKIYEEPTLPVPSSELRLFELCKSCWTEFDAPSVSAG